VSIRSAAAIRLGVMCAVIDNSGCILLSRRGDLNIWTLPGGRLDAGERLEDAACREVWEETGVKAEIDRAVGLFYLADWRRLNVLYEGYPVGGRLRDQTRETRANRYFTDGSVPQTVIGAKEALAAVRPPPRIVVSSRGELWRLRLRFGWRWLVNRLTGHPEPKFPAFDVRAVAVILGDSGRRVLTLPGVSYPPVAKYRTLPRVACDGSAAPWEQLGAEVRRLLGFSLEFQWVGLWEDAENARVEFVFAAAMPEQTLEGAAQWTAVRNGAFGDRDMDYVERVRPTFARDPVWTLAAHPIPADMIILEKEARL
jgi:ADP-ribose pyrophosphatase YjhB (NUDIX family)